MHRRDVVRALEGGLVVSCQPVRGGPLDRAAITAALAEAAETSGAHGLRIEGLRDLRAVRRVASLPTIALTKRSLSSTEVFITPHRRDIDALARAGADIVAFDATARPRPLPVAEAVDRIHALGLAAMADVSTAAEGLAAAAAGAELVATTLSGYAPGSPQQDTPDLDLVRALARDGVRVVAEGRLRTPAEAAAALAAGAYAVTIGSAITRPEHIIAWFLDAMRSAH